MSSINSVNCRGSGLMPENVDKLTVVRNVLKKSKISLCEDVYGVWKPKMFGLYLVPFSSVLCR